MKNKPLIVGVGALAAATATLFMQPTQETKPEPIFRDGFDGFGCQAQTVAPDGQFRYRLQRSQIDYGAMHYPRPNVVLNEWDNVWGCNSSSCSVLEPWPGVTGSAPIFMAFQRTSYIGLHFKTLANPAPGFANVFVNPTSNAAPPITMSISLQCGDFTAHLPSPGCLRQNVHSADEQLMYYQFANTSPSTACNLKPNTDYYVNIIQTDPTSQEKCTKPACSVAAWRN